METIRKIREIIETAERLRNAYFWTPAGNAAGRRSAEKRYSKPRVEWDDGKDHFTAEYTVSCSCHNFYAYGTYTRNGKKTTLTAIRNSLKRLEAAENI